MKIGNFQFDDTNTYQFNVPDLEGFEVIYYTSWG